ncbi:Cation/H(+) antiporter like [Thalictrum thalictroides]|uniref:Cation/H(+) antiporter like n=1 Tax=Thalictrum thalictroides TaxID=46969 RepID=A0A7J6WZC4_THATH|nr:Cation/H(+) antiporter like [Thalictrum thalictroides]
MALFTTFITTPSVMAVYKPARGIAPYIHRRLQTDSPIDNKKELRILACVHGAGNVPSLINLIESTRGGTKKSPLKLYVMHMVELTERSSSIVMVQRVRRNGLPFFNSRRKGDSLDRVAVAFQAYGQLGRVKVRPMTAISALSTMHEDVCQVAEDKRVTMMILPFHKRGNIDGDVEMENMGPAWRSVNQKVLREAQCSVALLVDRGLGSAGQQTPGPNKSSMSQGVCVLFFGGPDDREALELGGRMAEHPGVKVTVVRFVVKKGAESNVVMLRPSPDVEMENNYSFSTAVMDREREKALDEVAVEEFKKRWDGLVIYVEKVATHIVEEVLTIGQSGEHELIVVGKGRFPSTMVAELADRPAEHAELGPIGDILGSSRHGVVSSVLVIQQHDIAHANELPVSKVVDSDGQGTSTTTTLSPV